MDNNVQIQIDGGQVGTDTEPANVHGGGYGQPTVISGNVDVTIGKENAAEGATINGDVYGGSALATVNNNATDHTNVTLNAGTINGSLYGGALGSETVAANVYGPVQVTVNGDIVLTISSGHFNKVFGGNNLGGKLNGSITVNIEETGCHPVIIDELYGCGNQAAYSIYGYEEGLSASGDVIVKKSSENPEDNPTINVKSCTHIGQIFGGGYGAKAVVVGNPTVNVSMIEGLWKNGWPAEGEKTIPAIEKYGKKQLQLGTIGTVFGGGNAANVIGNTNVNIGTLETIQLVSGDNHADQNVQGVHITGNVYGGGSQADVTGKANVTVGRANTTPMPEPAP